MSQDTAAAIADLEARRYAAIVAADFAAMDEFYDEGLIYVHSSAVVDTKASYIDSIRSGRAKYLSAKQTDVKVTDHGNDVAQALSRVNLEVQRPDGVVLKLDMRTLATWQKKGGKWKMVSVQSTKMPA